MSAIKITLASGAEWTFAKDTRLLSPGSCAKLEAYPITLLSPGNYVALDPSNHQDRPIELKCGGYASEYPSILLCRVVALSEVAVESAVSQ